MTTILYLQGASEDFDDTLRGYIAKNWDKTNTLERTPKFQSGHGYDVEPTGDPISSKEWPAFTGQDLVQFREEDEDVQTMDNFRVQHTTLVNIGVYAESPALRRLFCQEVNRILLSRVPNSNTRIPKITDGQQSSAIGRFDDLQVAFTPIAAYEDVGTTWSAHGTLGCVWFEVQ